MDLETRFKNILLVLQKSNHEELTSSEVASRYLPCPSSSDILTTGTILNVMSLVGCVKKSKNFKGSTKVRWVKYKATNKINDIGVS